MPVLIPNLITTPTPAGTSTFPETPLELTAQAAFGADLTAHPDTWTWTDLTVEHPTIPGQTINRLTADPITIRRGVTVGARTTATTTGSLRLFNYDGEWTPHLASSPRYPHIDAGTPIRVRQRHDTRLFADDFSRTVAAGSWGTATSGQAWQTPGAPTQWSVSGGQGRIALAAPNDFYGIRSTQQVHNVDAVADITTSATSTGTSVFAGLRLRTQPTVTGYYWVYVEFQTSSNVLVGAYRFNSDGSSTFLGSVSAGTTYTAGQPIRLRVRHDGNRIQAKAWPPSGTEPGSWALNVTDQAITTPGAVGFTAWRVIGNTNPGTVTITVDNLTVTHLPYDRLAGYIADVRPTYQPYAGGQTWSTVQVDVGGIGSRLEKREAPAWSPMRRSVQNATETPIGYWPLEDDEGSTFGVSAFPAGPPMTVTGPAVFSFSAGTPTEQYLSKYGTKPMVSIAAGVRLSAVVPQSAVTDEWAVSFIGEFFAPTIGGGVTALRVVSWETPSSLWNRWALIAPSSGGYIVRAYNDAEGLTADAVTTGSASYTRPTYTVEARQSGGNIAVELFANDVSIGAGSIAGTMAAVTRITLNPDRTNTTASTDPYGIKFIVGHVRVVDEVSVKDTPYYTVPETSVIVTASNAWYKEPAHRRVERLCAEERVPFTLVGSPGVPGSTLLNAQQDGAFVQLVTDAAEAESGGMLYEHYFGYAYLPRAGRYNRNPDMVIDMGVYARSGSTGQGDVLSPELDSRATNVWTITRTGGVSGMWAADPAYRARRGTIAEERTLDLLTDAMVTDHAAWRVHLGVDGQGAKYPSAPVDLAANPALIDSYLRVDIGSRIQRTNQPTIAGIGTIDQVVEGMTETLTPTGWEATVDATPAQVWDVGVWDDTASRYAPSTTTLTTASLSTSATSFTMSGEPWQTGAYSPALLLQIGYEHIAVSNISGSGNGPYTCTVSQRAVNGRTSTHTAGAAVTLANPTRWAL